MISSVLSQQQVSEVAGTYFSKISEVIAEAFQDYLDSLRGINSLGIRTNLKARTSASLIHDFIRIRAGEKFANVANIKVDEFNGMFGLLISNRLFVRFKKLTPDMKTSNVQTEQIGLFNKQQLEIPGTNQVTLLTAGYVPDATWTILQNIFLTCKINEELVWYKDLHGETSQVSIFSTSAMDQNMPEVEKPIVRIKDKVNSRKTGSDKD